MKNLFILFFLSLFTVITVFSDEVIKNNGEVIQGKITEKRNGYIRIISTTGTLYQIDTEDIKEFNINEDKPKMTEESIKKSTKNFIIPSIISMHSSIGGECDYLVPSENNFYNLFVNMASDKTETYYGLYSDKVSWTFLGVGIGYNIWEKLFIAGDFGYVMPQYTIDSNYQQVSLNTYACTLKCNLENTFAYRIGIVFKTDKFYAKLGRFYFNTKGNITITSIYYGNSLNIEQDFDGSGDFVQLGIMF